MAGYHDYGPKGCCQSAAAIILGVMGCLAWFVMEVARWLV